MPSNEQMELGKAAYDGYAHAVGWKSVNGDLLPEWDQVSERLQLAWAIAAVSVARRVKGKIIKAIQHHEI